MAKDWSESNKEYRQEIEKGLMLSENKVNELIDKLKAQVAHGMNDKAVTTIKHIQIAQQERETLIGNLVIALIPHSAAPIPEKEWRKLLKPFFGTE